MLNRKTLLAVCLVAAPAFGQGLKESLIKHWKTSGEFTLKVANGMPEEFYTFRPNPAEMSFGELIAHIAIANVGACANASGLERPTAPPKIAEWNKDPEKIEVEKTVAVAYLSSAVDFCNKAVESIDPEKLHEPVGAARRTTRFEWLWSYFTHTAHHRGQAEVYMRVKGIKPPDYAF